VLEEGLVVVVLRHEAGRGLAQRILYHHVDTVRACRSCQRGIPEARRVGARVDSTVMPPTCPCPRSGPLPRKPYHLLMQDLRVAHVEHRVV
jgi:hypothetical protein